MKKLSRAKRKIQKAKWLKQKNNKSALEDTLGLILEGLKSRIPKEKPSLIDLNGLSYINKMVDAHVADLFKDIKPKHGRCLNFMNSWINYDGGETMENLCIEWFWHGKRVKDEEEFNRYESLKAFV